jgi:NADPH:quinone reductase-like Zn-dependent oxidoreductase
MRVPPALNASEETAWRFKNRSFFRSNVSHHRFTARVGKPRDREVALQLGAAEANSLGSETASPLRGTLDTVIDTVGGKTQRDLFGYLRKGGVLISSVSAPDGELAQRYEIEATFILVDVNTADLEVVADLLDAQRLIVRFGQVLPLAEARKAHEMLEALRPLPSGKLVLDATDG